jgi:hypothetical protein
MRFAMMLDDAEHFLRIRLERGAWPAHLVRRKAERAEVRAGAGPPSERT